MGCDEVTFLMVVPAIDPIALAGFLGGCVIPRERILLVDNAGEHPITWALTEEWTGRLHRAGRNLGVAASWNLGVRAVIKEQLDWLVIASTSFRFGPDGGMEFIAGLNGCHGRPGVHSGFGWHLVAIARSTLETVGEFDEAFWPAYWEETDFGRRMDLLGVSEGWATLDCPGDFGRQAAALVDGLVPEIDLEAMGRMYEFKWGAPYGEDDRQYQTPFGDPNIPLTGTKQDGYGATAVA